ncbi:MAG: HAD-IC family P-type ATPase [Deltaproteobacteria bacterium]|nr:HAD-IC family P-type ATPase [Deltaproteobacteria bacterium]
MNKTAAPAPSSTAVWYALSAAEALDRLKVDQAQGLDPQEAARRLEEGGPNQLREKPRKSRLALFFDQFKSTLILILIGAAVLAGAIGDIKDALVILVVTMLNAALGYFQESRAEDSLQALKKMLALKAHVRRGGHEVEIDTHELVVGDIVVLETGVRIPCDGRLVASKTMEVDESSLTGESHPAVKSADTSHPQDTPLAERANMVFMNTMVTRGRGDMVVTAIGMATEMGRLAAALDEAEEPPTPLQVQLDSLGKRLSLLAMGFIAVILALSIFQGRTLIEAVLQSIALAVAAIPEGLPAVVTVTLALGMQRMARNRSIVKRLSAVETLGSTTVICSDKTGTLTVNQMTARTFFFKDRRYDVSGEGYDPAKGQVTLQGGSTPVDLQADGLAQLVHSIVLCNDSKLTPAGVLGDPMEAALLVLGAKLGGGQQALGETLPRVAEIPFDSEHKFMATFHDNGRDILVFLKGAPEVVMDKSTLALTESGPLSLDEAARKIISEENLRLASEQMRVLAVASRSLPKKDFNPEGDLWRYMEGFTLTGLVGMVDPPRPEAKAAIELCHLAGISIKMITGDQPNTAMAIARELGLKGKALTGRELDELSLEDLKKVIQDISVFARVTAAHKLKIVEALQAVGHVVAMTGDGVNDAPALKKAHIGVAMGRSGTEVAKEAATMVLLDDNFATIVQAIEEGRTIYDNIVKFIRFQLSTNIGALLSVLAASLLGMPTPFNTIQILWINIIMDGPPAMAMGVEPMRMELMKEKPRAQNEQILSMRRLGTLMMLGSIMVTGTLGTLAWGISTQSREFALTLAFTTFVLFQFFNAFNARVEKGTAFNGLFFSNPHLWLALIGTVALQVMAVSWTPAQVVFETTDLGWQGWAVAIGVASSILVYGEIHRFVAGRFSRTATFNPHPI